MATGDITKIQKEIPDIIEDKRHNKKYRKGRFLGKGGFARCYELTDVSNLNLFAGKIVSKLMLKKKSQQEKMHQEITIHKSLSHSSIVGFYGYFEDLDNVYILLEICRKKSLMEMHKRRKYLTEPEVRYFTRHLVNGCRYLHEHNVIHRDLKLGNTLINDNMELKISDFGLATKLSFDGERKKTLCGTPNYIAPEIISKKGHSFEVDVWSLGCIVYTLLVGKPPFETSTLKDTYNRIKNNEFTIPPAISSNASNLIRNLLCPDPSQRPTMFQILEDPFFTGFTPSSLPVSCLTTAPRFDVLKNASASAGAQMNIAGTNSAMRRDKRIPLIEKNLGVNPVCEPLEQPDDCYLSDLYNQVIDVLKNAREINPGHNALEESEHPASSPVFWISKWVDYSDKYGLGYQLDDDSTGVLFNDGSRMLLTANFQNFQYIEENGTEHLFTAAKPIQEYEKKVTLLHYFRKYMSDFLMKAGENAPSKEAQDMCRLPYMRSWFRTKSAIVMHLSNGTLQLNFFQDHTKIILCPLVSAVTYIDRSKEFKTYLFSGLRTNGVTKDISFRMDYAQRMMDKMMQCRTKSGRLKISV